MLSLEDSDLSVNNFRETTDKMAKNPYLKSLVNEIFSRNKNLLLEVEYNKNDPSNLLSSMRSAAKESKEILAMTNSFLERRRSQHSLLKTDLVDVCDDQRGACARVAYTSWVVASLACFSLIETVIGTPICMAAAEWHYIESLRQCDAARAVCKQSLPK